MGGNKTHWSGGKFTASHTTMSGSSFHGRVAKIVNRCPAIYKVALGIIKPGLSPVRVSHVKLSKHEHNSYLLSIRGNTSYQKVEVYFRGDVSLGCREFACMLRDDDVTICFDEKDRKKRNRWRGRAKKK